jgi:hypothetical protein
MRGEPLVTWVADGAIEGKAQVLVRIQSDPFPACIHVLTEMGRWRNDAQLRLQRMGSGSGWLVTEAGARAIAASLGHDALDAWDNSVPPLDSSSPS